MVRQLVRTAVILAVLVGLTVAVALRIRRPGPAKDGSQNGPLTREDWAPVPSPAPASETWVEPEDRTCPTSHPIKGKLSSGRFHQPGMANYERTIPDRCYATPDGAAADGLQRARY